MLNFLDRNQTVNLYQCRLDARGDAVPYRPFPTFPFLLLTGLPYHTIVHKTVVQFFAFILLRNLQETAKLLKTTSAGQLSQKSTTF